MPEEAAMLHRRTPITSSRRTFAVALVTAGAAAGLLVGELAAAPTDSQARPLAAAAPASCKSFALDVSGALKALSVVVGDEGQYATFIPKAYQDGVKHDSGAYASLAGKLTAIIRTVETQNSKFAKLESPLLNTEKACLAS
jgi:hypothetical protein